MVGPRDRLGAHVAGPCRWQVATWAAFPKLNPPRLVPVAVVRGYDVWCEEGSRLSTRPAFRLVVVVGLRVTGRVHPGRMPSCFGGRDLPL